MSARRKPTRKVFWSLLILIIFAITGTFFLVNNLFTQFIMPVKTLLLITDPLLIVHLDCDDRSAVIVSLPSDVVISGADGYGDYPAISLWKLGGIDKKPDLLSRSLGRALAIVPPAFLTLDTEPPNVSSPIEFIKNTFSGWQFFSFMTHLPKSSLNYLQIISFQRIFNSVEPAKINLIDLASSIAVTAQLLPDGSQQTKLDLQLVDRALGSAFEDRGIRSLALRLRVDNPTLTPGLGAQIARELSRLGIIVVAVGNTGDLVDICLLEVRKDLSDAPVVKNIASRYGCNINSQLEENVVDARLILGRNNILQ